MAFSVALFHAFPAVAAAFTEQFYSRNRRSKTKLEVLLASVPCLWNSTGSIHTFSVSGTTAQLGPNFYFALTAYTAPSCEFP